MSALQLQEIFAGLNVVVRRRFFRELSHQQVVAAPERQPQVLLWVLYLFRFLGFGFGAGLGGGEDALLAFELAAGGGVEHAFVAESQQFGLVDDGGEEVGDGGLLVDFHVADLEGSVVLQGLLAVLEVLHVAVHALHAFLVLLPLLQAAVLHPLRGTREAFGFGVEGGDGELRLAVLEFLPHLDAVGHAHGEVELLEEFLHDLVLHDSVGPAQTAFVPLPGSEGEHVVVLVGVGPPERPQQGEAQFLPPVLPEVVNHLREELDVGHFEQFPMFAFDEAGHPALAAGEGHIFAGLEFEFHEGLLEEVGGEDAAGAVEEAVLVALEEGVVDLGEFVVAGEGEVEVRGQPDVVGGEFGEGFDHAGAGDRFNFGDGDVFFGRGRSCGLLRGDDYDQILVVGVEFLEGLAVVHELEGFGPVVFVPVPHPNYLINTNIQPTPHESQLTTPYPLDTANCTPFDRDREGSF